MNEEILPAIQRTKRAIEENPDKNWVIAYSGGKDSTATLKVFLAALKKADRKPSGISLIYCDTGVENPVIDSYVKRTLKNIRREAEDAKVPLSVDILSAPVQDRFFAKVVGRGYPTPTNSFRWCTKALRINPVTKYMRSFGSDDTIVVLGSRRDESQQRKRSIQKNGDDYWQKQGGSSATIYLPILDFSISDVWDAVFCLGMPTSIDAREIEDIYRDASGECPVLKSPNSPPCGSGRFGCWTCTVVRKDHSATKMVDAGHSELQPFLEFRNWLAEVRNDEKRRWPVRRNGVERPGPFSIAAREEILLGLFHLERTTGTEILAEGELEHIFMLWERDYDIEHELGLRPKTCPVSQRRRIQSQRTKSIPIPISA
ncbi:phosphoadenosine phosphosulfate reductase family protein [Shimia sp. R9_2]|uniref:phosphoadenosine phosphosulfate reductase domain-containing protein n=1 Tax=Shimia sp. R9_2 TaxID=2821112 RepID=UPI001AD9B301|nr:phosphoadenosine phosphosulfate reductase family protein [Shimia sp. R9_2]MBO9397196.1 phosphoadenosine phosphosulfate reductase family protein [Shimia sp. R9_2]